MNINFGLKSSHNCLISLFSLSISKVIWNSLKTCEDPTKFQGTWLKSSLILYFLLHQYTSLHTFLYTFPKLLTRRISLTIQSCFGWWLFPLFLWPYLIQGWICWEKLDTHHSYGLKGKIPKEIQVLFETKKINKVLFTCNNP